ncbi:glycosyltransferase [Agromyces sp. MMS24-JH15]|uniref:glycosyltransferase n=1 Tax=Agromyces sp. MMS24-JH15 TaxID=3243765 RepID=UPI00374A71EC
MSVPYAPFAGAAPPAAGGPRKLLLAASTGGHLQELVRQAEFLRPSDDSLWVTFASPQADSLLRGRRVLHVPYVRPRDYRGIARTIGRIRSLLRTEHFDAAVSTGAGIALAVLPVARMRRIPATYIESVCRVDGPSMTGRVLQRLRAADLRTQHPSWAGARWRPQPSILATFERRERALPDRPLRVFVTLGTIEGYRFDALVDAVLATGLAGTDTTWQVGFTDRDDLPGTVHRHLAPEEFDRVAREADVVVTHAGVGTLLGMLELGIHPLMAVRRSGRGEHVDDHQRQIADLVTDLGIAHAVEADELDADAMLDAARYEIIDREDSLEASVVGQGA